MTTDVQTGIPDLIGEGRVHRSIYTDPAIFAMEMKRIFTRTWVFIGHESEVPHAGDYKTDTVAGQPIVMTRDEEGTVHVLFNRCRHRGAKVCNLPYGNSSTFSCLYHGWTFSNKGDLIAVPSRQLCPADFDPGNYPLVSLPRVERYRGFVFGSLSRQGTPLEEHLGRATHYLDCLIDRSPDSEIQVCKPVMYSYPANWKLQIENYSDNIHARFTHEAAFAARRPLGAMERYGAGSQQRSDLRMGINRILSHGDSMTDYRGDRPQMAFAGRDEEYVNIMTEKHGAQRAREIADMDIHVIIYPNLLMHSAYCHYRVIQPVAVDKTVIVGYPFKLRGAPEGLNEAFVQASSEHISASGAVQVDDMEAFARVQEGLAVEMDEWVSFVYGIEEPQVPNEHGEIELGMMTEVPAQYQHKEWLRLMSED